MVLLISFIIFGIVIFLLRKYTSKKPLNNKEVQQKASGTTEKPRPEGCCGQHEVCEKETLLASSLELNSFNDEELDAYKGRDPQSYTLEEIKEFEDVLFTMRESEVAEWLRGLQIRGIELPEVVKDQALLIVSERRYE